MLASSLYEEIMDESLLELLEKAIALPYKPGDPRIYFYYDGPIAGEYEDPITKHFYLVYNISDGPSEDGVIEQWFVTSVSKKFLDDAKKGEITYREAIKGEQSFIYLVNLYWNRQTNLSQVKAFIVPVEDLTDDYLPAKGLTIFGKHWEDTLPVLLTEADETSERTWEIIRKCISTTFNSKRARRIISTELLRWVKIFEKQLVGVGNYEIVEEAVQKAVSLLEPDELLKVLPLLQPLGKYLRITANALVEKSLAGIKLPNEVVDRATKIIEGRTVPDMFTEFSPASTKTIGNLLAILALADHPYFYETTEAVLEKYGPDQSIPSWRWRELYRRIILITDWQLDLQLPHRKKLMSVLDRLKDQISPTFGPHLR